MVLCACKCVCGGVHLQWGVGEFEGFGGVVETEKKFVEGRACVANGMFSCKDAVVEHLSLCVENAETHQQQH